MFMVLFLVFIFILAVLFGSVSLVQDDFSLAELERRAKKAPNYAARHRRQVHLMSLTVMVRLGAWLSLILFIILSGSVYGVWGGLLMSIVAAGLYPICTRLPIASHWSTKLYEKAEPSLLIAAEKVPWLWRFFYGRLPDSFGRPQSFASHEELAEAIASMKLLNDDERHLLAHALTFGKKKVADVMTPKGVVQTVKKDEFIGPLVLDELHSLGHSRFPVIDGDIDHIVGVLQLRTLLSLDVKKSETAEALMDSQVFFIGENDSLQKALTQFIKRRYHLFIVVNKHRETVGIVTLEDVMEELMGKRIIDEDDVHEDMRTAATEKGKKNNNSPNGTYL